MRSSIAFYPNSSDIVSGGVTRNSLEGLGTTHIQIEAIIVCVTIRFGITQASQQEIDWRVWDKVSVGSTCKCLNRGLGAGGILNANIVEILLQRGVKFSEEASSSSPLGTTIILSAHQWSLNSNFLLTFVRAHTNGDSHLKLSQDFSIQVSAKIPNWESIELSRARSPGVFHYWIYRKRAFRANHYENMISGINSHLLSFSLLLTNCIWLQTFRSNLHCCGQIDLTGVIHRYFPGVSFRRSGLGVYRLMLEMFDFGFYSRLRNGALIAALARRFKGGNGSLESVPFFDISSSDLGDSKAQAMTVSIQLFEYDSLTDLKTLIGSSVSSSLRMRSIGYHGNILESNTGDHKSISLIRERRFSSFGLSHRNLALGRTRDIAALSVETRSERFLKPPVFVGFAVYCSTFTVFVEYWSLTEGLQRSAAVVLLYRRIFKVLHRE
ncbi:uncharacterized protein BDR25DRAFT_354626 [Lindgomyces ingoldianus]|uniref:Uncharacterized protein n=1 Tax=Lindgomyces ingoldianus TaxID=673940 RepID=A0ACB6QWX6_9PLEO|nr:uncharacterized protein BDR25DRAFT_354626 [Lindgomyces ingoldianus]KAF2471386.1 hypothetical protein BDR25DRAFT_354626 [Lindgomyces ingoldianus]